jgi:hypothetical protein
LRLEPGITLTTLSAFAQVYPQVRVRGTITKVDGQVMTVQSRDGSMVDVHLTDDSSVAALMKMTLADIKQRVFVGAAAVPLPNGMLRALEIHLIPGRQNGNRFSWPFDLAPDSSMINATDSTTVDGVDGRTVTLIYKGGEKKVVIPANLTRTRQRFACRLITSSARDAWSELSM